MTKPPHSSVDGIGSVDELFTLPIYTPSHGEESSDPIFSASQRCASPRAPYGDVRHPTDLKRKRTSDSSAGVSSRSCSSSSPSSPYNTCDSVGGDEIDLLRRKDEDVADMGLFLAKTVGETSSRHSLAELVAFVDRLGISRVMLALRRVGGLAVFVGKLHQAAFVADEDRRLAITFLCTLIDQVSGEALFQECVVNFYVKCLHPESTQEALTVLRRRTASHWSVRSKQHGTARQRSPKTPDVTSDGLQVQIEKLCGTTLSSSLSSEEGSTASLALCALLTLMFSYNRHPHLAGQRHLSVPLSFAQVGGLEQLGRLLTSRNTQERALALLEVLTSTEELRGHSPKLLALVPRLVAELDVPHTQLPVLKILTNITNIQPNAFSDTGTATAFARFALQTLSHSKVVPCTPDEREIFALCCAINVVKHESKGGESSTADLATAFAASQDTLVSLAESMMQSYRCTSTEILVRSGYYALLLGALSLVAVPEEEGRSPLRVPVMTAVARVTGDTCVGPGTTYQPMRIVVAIIQEFLLFQSSAGTLTKETLLEMNALVDRIVSSNQIDVTQEIADSCAAEEKAGPSSSDEEENLVLGQLMQNLS